MSVTPCGTESGREPILDWHGEVVVKFLDDGVRERAGKRNVGIESDGCTEGRDTHWAHRRRAGANMVLMLVDGLVGDFLQSMLAEPPGSRDSATLETPNVLRPTTTLITCFATVPLPKGHAVPYRVAHRSWFLRLLCFITATAVCSSTNLASTYYRSWLLPSHCSYQASCRQTTRVPSFSYPNSHRYYRHS